jgi:hypothetical protein
LFFGSGGLKQSWKKTILPSQAASPKFSICDGLDIAESKTTKSAMATTTTTKRRLLFSALLVALCIVSLYLDNAAPTGATDFHESKVDVLRRLCTTDPTALETVHLQLCVRYHFDQHQHVRTFARKRQQAAASTAAAERAEEKERRSRLDAEIQRQNAAAEQERQAERELQVKREVAMEARTASRLAARRERAGIHTIHLEDATHTVPLSKYRTNCSETPFFKGAAGNLFEARFRRAFDQVCAVQNAESQGGNAEAESCQLSDFNRAAAREIINGFEEHNSDNKLHVQHDIDTGMTNKVRAPRTADGNVEAGAGADTDRFLFDQVMSVVKSERDMIAWGPDYKFWTQQLPDAVINKSVHGLYPHDSYSYLPFLKAAAMDGSSKAHFATRREESACHD